MPRKTGSLLIMHACTKLVKEFEIILGSWNSIVFKE